MTNMIAYMVLQASKYPLKGVFHIAGKILNAPVGNMKVMYVFIQYGI